MTGPYIFITIVALALIGGIWLTHHLDSLHDPNRDFTKGKRPVGSRLSLSLSDEMSRVTGDVPSLHFTVTSPERQHDHA